MDIFSLFPITCDSSFPVVLKKISFTWVNFPSSSLNQVAKGNDPINAFSCDAVLTFVCVFCLAMFYPPKVVNPAGICFSFGVMLSSGTGVVLTICCA